MRWDYHLDENVATGGWTGKAERLIGKNQLHAPYRSPFAQIEGNCLTIAGEGKMSLPSLPKSSLLSA